MRRVRLNAIGWLLVMLALVGCGSSVGSGDSSRDVALETSVATDAADTADTADAGPTVLESVVIIPLNETVQIGSTEQYTAVGRYSDGTSVDLTTEVEWVSSNPPVATIDARGRATGVAAGSTLIGARSGAVHSNRATLIVSEGRRIVSLSFTPTSMTLFPGASSSFTLTALYNDSTTRNVTQEASWSSSTEVVATVSNAMGSRGVVTGGMVPGVTLITATLMGISGNARVTVEAPVPTALIVTPASASMAPGESTMLRATVRWSDGRETPSPGAVTWSSSNAVAATVDASGLVSAACAGRATISAESVGLRGSAEIEVTGPAITAIAITPTDPRLACDPLQLRAIATMADGSAQDISASVHWESATPSVATVSSSGLATPVASGGPVSLSASRCGVTGTTSVTVTCDSR